MIEDKVFDIKELSQYLRVSEKTALNLLRSNKIKANKAGRSWRILRSETDKFLRGE